MSGMVGHTLKCMILSLLVGTGGENHPVGCTMCVLKVHMSRSTRSRRPGRGDHSVAITQYPLPTWRSLSTWAIVLHFAMFIMRTVTMTKIHKNAKNTVVYVAK